MAKQANLFPVDVEAVWTDFVNSSEWNPEAAQHREAHLKEHLAKLRARRDKLAEECEAAEKELSGLNDRDRKAKAFLESAAKQMGRFATHTVLLTSLLEAYPPLQSRKKRKPSAGTPTVVAADDEVPIDNDVRASMIRSFIWSTLDCEGMKISDMLALPAAKQGSFTYGEMSTALHELVAQKMVLNLGGRGRGVIYAKPRGEPA